MIPAILSIILLVFVWLGNIAEARHAHLRQQHVAARNELTGVSIESTTFANSSVH